MTSDHPALFTIKWCNNLRTVCKEGRRVSQGIGQAYVNYIMYYNIISEMIITVQTFNGVQYIIL